MLPTQDIAYANDAVAEEDYAETQQNTDTEAASSDADEDAFSDMHEQHAEGMGVCLRYNHTTVRLVSARLMEPSHLLHMVNMHIHMHVNHDVQSQRAVNAQGHSAAALVNAGLSWIQELLFELSICKS